MCYDYSRKKTDKEIAEYFKAKAVPDAQLPLPSLHVRLSNQILAVVRDPEADAARVLTSFKWGFVPWWEKNPKSLRPGNARDETLFTSGLFRSSAQSRRCLVPADGFYEWVGEKGSKQLVPFKLDDSAIFGFAGVWDRAPDGTETAAIITTEPNDLVRPIHNRMPVIVRPEDYDDWLARETPQADLQFMMAPYGGGMLRGEPVAPKDLQ